MKTPRDTISDYPRIKSNLYCSISIVQNTTDDQIFNLICHTGYEKYLIFFGHTVYIENDKFFYTYTSFIQPRILNFKEYRYYIYLKQKFIF